MQTFQEIFSNLLKDIEVKLTDEFDRSFERKAFFNTAWDAVKYHNQRSSLMMRTSDGLRGAKPHPPPPSPPSPQQSALHAELYKYRAALQY